jgi:hypothetical protein
MIFSRFDTYCVSRGLQLVNIPLPHPFYFQNTSATIIILLLFCNMNIIQPSHCFSAALILIELPQYICFCSNCQLLC